jgi:hypothetical protein
MMTKLIPAVLLVMIAAFSCTDDKDTVQITPTEEETQKNVTLPVDSTFQHCDSLSIATYHGTACCVRGPMRAKPGETATYHYQINHKDPQFSWEIREGDIAIIKGQDTHTVTVQFGPNFTTGIIGCVGSGLKDGVRNKCSDRCVVRTP